MWRSRHPPPIWPCRCGISPASRDRRGFGHHVVRCEPREGFVLDEGLGSDRHERLALCLRPGRRFDGHTATDAVSASDKFADTKLLAQPRDDVSCFRRNEFEFQSPRMRIRAAEAEAVTGDDASARRRGETVGEAAPQLNASKGNVKQQARRGPACLGAPRRPGLGMETASLDPYPAFLLFGLPRQGLGHGEAGDFGSGGASTRWRSPEIRPRRSR